MHHASRIVLSVIFTAVFVVSSLSVSFAYDISGMVYDDSNTPISSGQVYVYEEDPVFGNGACGALFQASTTITNGAYTLTGLTSGTYYLEANPVGNNVREWWAASASDLECANAESIIVTTQNVSGIDFQLDLGGMISGAIFDDQGTPITFDPSLYDWVDLYPAKTECGQGSCKYALSPRWGMSINPADGTFSGQGFPAGSYLLMAGVDGYMGEWWASTASVSDCMQAQVVTITPGGNLTNKNFQLSSTARISGTLYDSDGVPASGSISLHKDTCDGSGVFSFISANPDGTFSRELSPGSYYLKGSPSNTVDMPKWYGATSSIPTGGGCNQAQKITVKSGDNTTGLDFHFEKGGGGSISGTLFDSFGQPITDGSVFVSVFTGSCAQQDSVFSFPLVNLDGKFTISGLFPGDYYVRTYWMSWGSVGNYLNEYWASPSSQTDCANAQKITVGDNQAVTGKNFQLDAGAIVTGMVYDYTYTNPLSSGTVYAVSADKSCAELDSPVASGTIDPAGTYSVKGIPPGNIYLVASAGQGLIPEWWAIPESRYSCSGAQSLAVTAGQTVSGKNFGLDQGVTISGTVYDALGNPITECKGSFFVRPYNDNPCSAGGWSPSAYSGTYNNSNYTLAGVTPGDTIYLSADAYTYMGSLAPFLYNYQEEYWADPYSVTSCSAAQSFVGVSGQTITGKDFQLSPPSGGIMFPIRAANGKIIIIKMN